MDSKSKEALILKELAALNIPYKIHRHVASPTVEAMMEQLKLTEGAKCKNLVFKDKKGSRKNLLLTALADSTIDVKTLSKKLSCGILRMVDEEVLTQKLNVGKGSVTPLALFFDKEESVEFFMDEKLKAQDTMLVHPLHHEASVALKVDDLVRFCETHHHKVTWIELTDKPKEQAVESNQVEGNILGITAKKATDFSEWYTQVIVRSEMIEYYDISGCYIIRPWAYHIWEVVVKFFDAAIKELGVENGYFPLFVSKHRLEAEASHIEGFSPEVAWVTKYGSTDLAEPIAIRPTSETIMYPAFSKWIRSHRDLPLKLNMWNAVVRWEFKQPTPFIRTREFLWQEGHTAHADEEEAMEMVMSILRLYERWYTEYLAVPVIPGTKSEGEKFAGGKKTMTLEGYIPETGRGIQAATSHLLGTNFAKMFDIQFEDAKGAKKLVHQTSWGCTTRSLGVMIMTHGDDKGLVLPPKVASVQVVIIPISYKDEKTGDLVERCEVFAKELRAAGVRVRIDDRTNYTPGWKYNHWEVKGVPIRMELGPKDMTKQSVRLVRRDTGLKADIPWASSTTEILALLDQIQNNLYTKAKERMDKAVIIVTEFKDVMPVLNKKQLLLVPWCCEEASEDQIKAETAKLSALQGEESDSQQAAGMKPLCIPIDQPHLPEGTKCFYTGKPAKQWALWGRSY